MAITILKAGLMSALQGGPWLGLRHLGVPAGGAADPLSLALANKLVGNAWNAPALEAALLGPTLRFEGDTAFSLTGGEIDAKLNGRPAAQHETLFAQAGDELVIGSLSAGARVYLAIAGGFVTNSVPGVPASILQPGDVLDTRPVRVDALQTPERFRAPVSASWALRVCNACETPLLDELSHSALFDTNWIISRRADRMGLQLEGPELKVASAGRMPSAGVFPGTIQCPEDGRPFVLSVDAGTVGGYPRIAQVARVDRHLLGQLRPGNRLRLLPRDPGDAVQALRAKLDYWREWLPEIDEIV